MFEQENYESNSLETYEEKRLTIGAPGMDVMKEVVALNKEYMANYTDLSV